LHSPDAVILSLFSKLRKSSAKYEKQIYLSLHPNRHLARRRNSTPTQRNQTPEHLGPFVSTRTIWHRTHRIPSPRLQRWLTPLPRYLCPKHPGPLQPPTLRPPPRRPPLPPRDRSPTPQHHLTHLLRRISHRLQHPNRNNDNITIPYIYIRSPPRRGRREKYSAKDNAWHQRRRADSNRAIGVQTDHPIREPSKRSSDERIG
jgi:hypothetical protein